MRQFVVVYYIIPGVWRCTLTLRKDKSIASFRSRDNYAHLRELLIRHGEWHARDSFVTLVNDKFHRSRIFRSSENEFVEILTILKSKPSTAQKLHGVMMKELYGSMNGDLEDMFMEGSLPDALTKIAKLSEESTTSANENAWLVMLNDRNMYLIVVIRNSLISDLSFKFIHHSIAGVHRATLPRI